MYRRAIRDLVGHGEGIFGLIDGYPDGVPMAPPERLEVIERRCLSWRWKLKGHGERLRRTHGDFHPFNLVFDPAGEPRLLDTSRGSAGDPADDVMCLAVNSLFFALEAPGSWPRAFRTLWQTFFRTYLERTGDRELFTVAAPFLAWRVLVPATAHRRAFREKAREVALRFFEVHVNATPELCAARDAKGLYAAVRTSRRDRAWAGGRSSCRGLIGAEALGPRA